MFFRVTLTASFEWFSREHLHCVQCCDPENNTFRMHNNSFELWFMKKNYVWYNFPCSPHVIFHTSRYNISKNYLLRINHLCFGMEYIRMAARLITAICVWRRCLIGHASLLQVFLCVHLLTTTIKGELLVSEVYSSKFSIWFSGHLGWHMYFSALHLVKGTTEVLV